MGIQFKQVTKRYGGSASPLVVQGIDFVVPKGSLTTILGPSGCGKSTILKSIAGFINPVEGEILLKGKPISAPGPDRLMVFQEFDQLLPYALLW